MDDNTARLDAAAGQIVRETLDRLRDIARCYADDQNTAAPRLAAALLDTSSAAVLANTLANLLLDQVRAADTEALLQPALLADDIGPGSGMARYVQRANIADIGKPLVDQHTAHRLDKVFDVDDGVARCRFCRCTEDHACEGGCAWATDEQIRAAGLEPMEGDVCTACLNRPTDADWTFTHELGGVEVRLIGPAPAVRAVQAIMRDSGIPELGERGPFHAVDRDDNAVRVYWATDVNTARRSKNRTRGGRPDRPSKQRGQERRGQ